MPSRKRVKRTTLSAADLALCKRVFEQVCADEQVVDKSSLLAEIIALTVMAIFYFQEMGSHLDAYELKEGTFVAHTLSTYQLPSLIPKTSRLSLRDWTRCFGPHSPIQRKRSPSARCSKQSQ